MEESVRWSRSRAFGSVADVYERSRPGYPPEAVYWLLADLVEHGSYAPDAGYASGPDHQSAPADNPQPRPPLIVELAAGTGKLTRSLVEYSRRVVAIEPAAPMLTRLVRYVPVATPVQAVAEKIPLASNCADAVVVAQAFHWFDIDVALEEIARILRPHGTLGVVWNQRDESVPWVRELSAVLATVERTQVDQAAELLDKLEWSRHFTPPEYAGFRLWQRLDREGLLHLVSSRSYVASLPPGERQEILDQVGELYDMTARQPDGLVMPYVTRCYRTRLRG
ncbi:MAG TPA: class I SAM-dependent methyltransferase [Actinopolymorphaceae bacterium]|jgi:SAM-dependent methyltransferase